MRMDERVMWNVFSKEGRMMKPAKLNDGETAKSIEKEACSGVLSIESIVQKRLRLLRLLEENVESGDMKAIELYSKLLSELREDLKIKDEGGDWLRTLVEMVENE